MQPITNDIASPGNEVEPGSLNMNNPIQQVQIKELEPWEIAEKLLPIAKGKPVSVERATDAQFQTWIAEQGIPVDDSGFPEWSFDDRCGVINHALSYGVQLQFFEEQKGE